MTYPDLADEPDRRQNPARSAKRRKRRIVHAIVWPLLAVIIIGGGFAAWSLFSSAMSVRGDLEEASAAVSDFQAAATARELDKLQPIAEELAASAERAVEPTAQPLWRIGELVPFVGENFRAVRVIAEGVDEVSSEIVQPAVGVLADFGLRRDDATGGLDLGPLRQASEIAATADRVITDLHAQVRSIDTGATISQVSDGVEQFDEVLTKAQEAVPQLNGALAGIGALLGIDGPRNVVLAFLNNAEATAQGGGPAAQSLLKVDNGKVDIALQVSSAEFRNQAPLDVPMDESASQLYNDILFTENNAATSRPDFPTSAQLISARWQRDLGITPDVVVSLDPLALSRLLQVTGPVSMANGEQLTSDNVVSKLLSEAYFRFPEGGAENDAYFAGAASAVFDKIMSADYDVWAMADALVDVANRGSLMMWSSDAATQDLFAGTRLQGTLPSGNDSAVLGVYFRDRSASKIDYYLHTEAIVTTNACTPDAPSYTIEVRLRFDIPDGIEVPEYVRSQLYDFYRTEVFLYGPVGATTTAVEVPEAGLETVTGPSVVDLARPAEKFTVDLENGQSAVVRATFAGAPGAPYGPTEVRTTPMIKATNVTMAEATCG